MNRVIRARDLNAIFLAGPGHGGPAVLANVYLEGTYSEIYPSVTTDVSGLRALFRQFSTPGGVPSHVGPPTPGSIHEGGELGYVLTHAFGAVFDNPSLLALAVVGDGEAETGPLEGSWKGDQLSESGARRGGAADPAPQRLQDFGSHGPRAIERRRGHGVCSPVTATSRASSQAIEPAEVHQAFAAALDGCLDTIARIQGEARAAGKVASRPRWPVLVLRTPKGWTGPKEVDGVPVEGTFRAHQVPLAEVRSNPAHLAMLGAMDEELSARGALRRAGTSRSHRCARWRRGEIVGWAPTRTPTAAASPSRSI